MSYLYFYTKNCSKNKNLKTELGQYILNFIDSISFTFETLGTYIKYLISIFGIIHVNE